MGRWHCSLAGLLGLLALSAGCAANRPGNPFGGKIGKSTTAQAATNKKSPADEAALADRKTSTGDRSGNGADRSTADADAASQSAQNGGHDPATIAYIDQELRDATPDERATQMANLKGLHPDAVRQILRSRRMALRSVQQQQEMAQRSEIYSQGTVQPVAAESPPRIATGQRRSNSAEGLGTVSAWPRPPVDASRAVQILPEPGAPENNSSWSQSGALPGQASGQPPIGHSSGYRVDPEVGSSPSGAVVAVRPGPAPPARTNTPPGQFAPGQYNVAQAVGAVTAPLPRGAAAKPAAVAVGVPMSAGGGPPNAANGTPADGSAGGPKREQLARLISVAESEAFEIQPGESEVEKQAYVEKQVHLRMLYLMSGQQERALQAIPGLDPADQEFWQQTFWGLTNYFDVNSIPSSADRAAQTVTQMTNAVLRLQEKARLELRNVTFCHKISSFGNYEKYPRDEFSPGQEVLLYADVANIHSEPIPDGKFRTSLKSTIEIYRHGPQGEMIERIELPETIDICRTHRRDYFHSYQFTIPPKLALGPHVLKLSVEDQLSRRVGTYTLNFTVK